MLLSPNPILSVSFTGLLAFGFGKQNKYCQVGIHSSTDDHELRFRVARREGASVIEIAPTITLKHQWIRPMPDLWFDIEGGPASARQPPSPFIVGDPNQPPTNPKDFRHMIDFGGRYFYDGPVDIVRGVFGPSLFFTTGVFHTLALTKRSFRTVPAPQQEGAGHMHTPGATALEEMNSAQGHSLGRVTEIVGANIYLEHPRQELVIRFSDRKGHELFRMRNQENVTYELTIDNGNTPDNPGNDFGHYYHGIRLRPGQPMILIEEDVESGGITILGEEGSPCLPAGFGGNPGLGSGSGGGSGSAPGGGPPGG